jgi:hypothetical protein
MSSHHDQEFEHDQNESLFGGSQQPTPTPGASQSKGKGPVIIRTAIPPPTPTHRSPPVNPPLPSDLNDSAAVKQWWIDIDKHLNIRIPTLQKAGVSLTHWNDDFDPSKSLSVSQINSCAAYILAEFRTLDLVGHDVLSEFAEVFKGWSINQFDKINRAIQRELLHLMSQKGIVSRLEENNNKQKSHREKLMGGRGEKRNKCNKNSLYFLLFFFLLCGIVIIVKAYKLNSPFLRDRY